MDKTAVVQVERLVRHPLYGKYVKRRRKVKVHDARNECEVGDQVLIVETRPLSRDKRWRLHRIVEKAPKL